MERSGDRGYYIILIGTVETLIGDIDETKDREYTMAPNNLNKMEYIILVLLQDDNVCLYTSE